MNSILSSFLLPCYSIVYNLSMGNCKMIFTFKQDYRIIYSSIPLVMVYSSVCCVLGCESKGLKTQVGRRCLFISFHSLRKVIGDVLEHGPGEEVILPESYEPSVRRSKFKARRLAAKR